MPFLSVPTSTASDLLASAQSTLSNQGVAYLVAIAIGIPLAFYVVGKVKGIVLGRNR